MTDMTEAWARAEAEKRYPEGDGVLSRAAVDLERAGFAAGVKLLADRLLSDEAVAEATRARRCVMSPADPEHPNGVDCAVCRKSVRDILVAALAAVTEGSK